ncbi:MAG: peptidylprolyl isomerase [Eubacteriales bacterium]|nr:peptidylprolyl isomerase [Eubacteriales bacterium]
MPRAKYKLTNLLLLVLLLAFICVISILSLQAEEASAPEETSAPAEAEINSEVEETAEVAEESAAEENTDAETNAEEEAEPSDTVESEDADTSEQLETLRKLALEDALIVNGDQHVSLAELNFHAALLFQQLAQVPAFSPDAQEYLDIELPAEEGDKPMRQVIRDLVLQELPGKYSVIALAQASDHQLSDDDQLVINNFISSLKDNAAAQSIDFTEFLEGHFGPGITEDLLREFVTSDLLESSYLAEKYHSYNYSDEELEQEFQAHPEKYSLVDYWEIKLDPELTDTEIVSATQALSEQKEAADFAKTAMQYADKTPDFLAQIGYDNSVEIEDFITEQAQKEKFASSSLDETSASWLVSADRQEGDSTVIQRENGNYALFFVSSAKDERQNYNSRHILVNYKGSREEDKTITLATIEAIEAAYKQDPTEEHFIELAQKYSDDSGSKQQGGLYEDISQGSFVPPYEEFCLAPDRQEGDVGLVNYEGTNYSGYHLIFFKGLEEANWKRQSDQSLRQADQAAFLDQIKAESQTEVVDSVLDYLLVGPATPTAAAEEAVEQ